LSVYLPLAGKLAYVAGTGDVLVDYTDDSDVAFVGPTVPVSTPWTSAGSRATKRTTSRAAFLALVPDLPTKVLPAPVLSKATRIPAAASRSPTARPCGGSWLPRCPPPERGRRSPLPAPHYGREAIYVPNDDESTILCVIRESSRQAA
jgi:hypothetical protein